MTLTVTFDLFLKTFKVLLEWIQIWYDMVTLFVQNNIQKTRTQNMQLKAEISMKKISFSESGKRSAFSAG